MRNDGPKAGPGVKSNQMQATVSDDGEVYDIKFKDEDFQHTFNGSASSSERDLALEHFTALTEQMFDTHVDHLRDQVVAGKTAVPDWALDELLEIRHSLRKDSSLVQSDEISIEDPRAHLELMQSIGNEAALHHERFDEAVRDLGSKKGALLEEHTGSVIKMMLVLGRMVAKAFKVVHRFLKFVFKAAGRVYVGPGTELSPAEGCEGVGVHICWDLTETLIEVWEKAKETEKNAEKLYEEFKVTEKEEEVEENSQAPTAKPCKDRAKEECTGKCRFDSAGKCADPPAGLGTRIKKYFTDLIGVVAKCHDDRTGLLRTVPYPVEVGMCFQVGMKGCVLPIPHGRPHIGFGIDINAGMISCLVERGWQSAAEVADNEIKWLDKVAKFGAHMLHAVITDGDEKAIVEDMKKTQELTEGKSAADIKKSTDPQITKERTKDGIKNLVTGGLRTVVGDTGHHTCLNGLGFGLPLFPVPFPMKLGVAMSVKRCGWGALKSIRETLFSVPLKEEAKRDKEELDPHGVAIKTKDGSFDDSSVEKFVGHAHETHDHGPCEALDCLFEIEASVLEAGVGVALMCGPVASALKCSQQTVKKAWAEWSGRQGNKLTDPNSAKLQLPPISGDGFCCFSEGRELKWEVGQPPATAECGHGVVNADLVAKGTDLSVAITWVDQRNCDKVMASSHLGYAEVDPNRFLVKPHWTGPLGQERESVKEAKRWSHFLVLVEFTYAPNVNQLPENYCCCVPSAQDARCEEVKNVDKWGLETCAQHHPAATLLPVILFAPKFDDKTGDILGEENNYQFPVGQECTNVWKQSEGTKEFQRIWLPKFRGLQDAEIHGITEALIPLVPPYPEK